jgi:hypothetical protein
MFEGAPPCFDHGVRELQFREGQDPAQHARGDQVVDLGVQFSTPASANTTGVLLKASRPDWLRPARPRWSPAQTCQPPATPRIRREKLSITACT